MSCAVIPCPLLAVRRSDWSAASGVGEGFTRVTCTPPTNTVIPLILRNNAYTLNLNLLSGYCRGSQQSLAEASAGYTVGPVHQDGYDGSLVGEYSGMAPSYSS